MTLPPDEQDTPVETMKYGRWMSYGDPGHVSVEGTVLAFIATRDSDWCRRVEATGAFTQMVADYRQAINEALPLNVSLVEDTFFGPVHLNDYSWVTGEFSIAETVATVDLAKIVEANDPDL